jgi:hypothetical protein
LQRWSSRNLAETRRGLAIALTCRPADEPVRHQELLALPQRGFPVHHISAVLEDAGLLVERIDPVEVHWLRRLHGVGGQLAADINAWLRWLRHGDDRTKPPQCRHRFRVLYLDTFTLSWWRSQAEASTG